MNKPQKRRKTEGGNLTHPTPDPCRKTHGSGRTRTPASNQKINRRHVGVNKTGVMGEISSLQELIWSLQVKQSINVFAISVCRRSGADCSSDTHTPVFMRDPITLHF